MNSHFSNIIMDSHNSLKLIRLETKIEENLTELTDIRTATSF